MGGRGGYCLHAKTFPWTSTKGAAQRHGLHEGRDTTAAEPRRGPMWRWVRGARGEVAVKGDPDWGIAHAFHTCQMVAAVLGVQAQRELDRVACGCRSAGCRHSRVLVWGEPTSQHSNCTKNPQKPKLQTEVPSTTFTKGRICFGESCDQEHVAKIENFLA